MIKNLKYNFKRKLRLILGFLDYRAYLTTIRTRYNGDIKNKSNIRNHIVFLKKVNLIVRTRLTNAGN